jgi:hypothetical protein
MHDAKDIEVIHTKFLRRVLGVKKSTNLSALYGELCRYPLHITRKLNMIRYWSKILKLNVASLVKQAYLLLKSDTDVGRNYNGKHGLLLLKTPCQVLAFHISGTISLI